MKNKIVNIKTLLSLIVILILVIALSPISKIREVNVIDVGNINKNFDENLYQINSNFFLFDKNKYAQKLLDTGLIESVKIKKQFFGKLEIEVKWKETVIVLKSGERFIKLEKNGFVLEIASDSNGDVIDGIKVKAARIGKPIVTENDYILENAVNLYMLIVENKGLFYDRGINANIYVRENNIIQVLNEKFEIHYGDGDDIENKFSKALAIYNNLSKDDISTGIINVSRKNHFVYETWDVK